MEEELSNRTFVLYLFLKERGKSNLHCELRNVMYCCRERQAYITSPYLKPSVFGFFFVKVKNNIYSSTVAEEKNYYWRKDESFYHFCDVTTTANSL